MLSVTSEAAASVSFQNARPKPARDDQSPPSDSFGALVDANAQASQTANAQASNQSDQQDASPDRRAPDATAGTSRADNTATNDDDAQPRDTQALSGRPLPTDSPTDTGIQKPATDTDASTSAADHPAKPAGTKVATTKDTSDSELATSDATAADSAAASQPIVTPVVAIAIAATIPLVATPSTPAATPAATAVAGSATEAPQAAAMLLPQQTNAKPAKPIATTGFNPAITAKTAPATTPIIQDTTPDASQTAQPGTVQTGFEGEALAAVVADAAPATAKPTVKTQDTAQPAKATPSVTTGFQPGPTAPDPTATPATSTSPAAPSTTTPDNHKQDAATTPDTAKNVSSDTGAPAAQPAATAPQHPAHATDAAPQPQPGQTDGGQQQGISSVIPQPQMQSATATAPVAPPFNVAVAAGAAVPLNGLAVQIAVTAQSGKSRFEIRLDPADLGRIDVRLDVDRQGQVTSHLTVEKPETLAMLRQDAPQLQRALLDAGLKTGDGGLQFSLRDQSSSGHNTRDDTGRNTQRLIVTEDDIVPAATAGRTYGRMLGSSSGLDIRV